MMSMDQIAKENMRKMMMKMTVAMIPLVMLTMVPYRKKNKDETPEVMKTQLIPISPGKTVTSIPPVRAMTMTMKTR